jgi:hypothetical protein
VGEASAINEEFVNLPTTLAEAEHHFLPRTKEKLEEIPYISAG